MKHEYKTEYFDCANEGASLHVIEEMDEFLHKHSSQDWMINQMQKVSTGYLFIFERFVKK